MATSKGNGSGDPREFVRAPVSAALGRIATAALIGFSAVAAASVLPLMLHVDRLGGPCHPALHGVIPLCWVGFAALIGMGLLVHPSHVEGDPWPRARDADPSLTSFARGLSALLEAGWLVMIGASVVHHHFVTPRDTFVTLAILAPLTLAAWIVAVVAWRAWCRATLGRATHESEDRLRRYWRGVAHAPGH